MTDSTMGAISLMSSVENGSPNMACATIESGK